MATDIEAPPESQPTVEQELQHPRDAISSSFEGWSGIQSPDGKDYFARYQVTADGWFIAHPDLTVTDTSRLQRVGAAVDPFPDKAGDQAWR